MSFSRVFASLAKTACVFLLLGLIASQPVSPVEAIDSPQGECTDSDGGKKYYRQGEVIEFLGLPMADQCLDSETLLEYTCSETGEAESVEYPCPNGCSNGSCIGPNIIVVGWDGAQWDHFEKCFNQELPECADGLPNLMALSDGVIYQSTTTNASTHTMPGWVQILTGYNAEVTGVYSNTVYRELHEGYSLFERFNNYFGSENVVSMLISGKGNYTGGEEGEPWFLTKSHLDYFETSFVQNGVIGTRALALLDAHPNDLIFASFIFWDPDTGGHVFTEESPEYSLRLIDSDMWLGRIVEKLDALGIADNTIIYVTTDHGFDESGNHHLNAPYGFLASNDPSIMRNGDRKDLGITILQQAGIPLDQSLDIPPLSGYSLYAPLPMECVPEGEAYIDYPGAPMCCAGLELISLDKYSTMGCLQATGGGENKSGYCTSCGNGSCDLKENDCNCPEDCPETTGLFVLPVLVKTASIK